MSDNFFAYLTHPNVVKRAFFVALVVGTLLNIINQGSDLLNGTLVWWKLALTYLVPYCVSSYSSASERMKFGQHCVN